MGAEQSKGEDQNSIEQILQKYQQQKKFNHPSFGEIQILKEKTSDLQMGLKEFNLTDESEFIKVIEKFKPKVGLDNPNLIRLHNCIQHKESQFCSTFFKVYLVFDYVDNTLEQEVFERSKDVKQPFSEEEMWNILTSCIQGAYSLYQNKLSHNNIRPSTVYITQSGIVKLADPTLFSQQGLYPSALSSLNNVPQGIYISPELLNDMYQQQYNPVYNQQKSDVFSLGMCMLHAALLQPLDDCYDYKQYSINESLIHERLNKVRENYGDNLYQFLYHMINLNSEDRQDLQYFYQIISQQGDYAETATFQQVESHQPVANKQVEYTTVLTTQTKSPERVYQPYETITTKTTTTASNQKQQEDDKVKRSAANPNSQASVQVIQQQPQIILSKTSNQPGYSSAGLFKDSEDKGSSISYIPKDQTSKNAVPDENIGNAIGGADTYYQSEGFGQTGVTTTTTTNNYAYPNSTYIPQSYSNPSANTINQDYSSKYTPVSNTTTTVTYTNPTVGVSSYTPITQYSNITAPASTSKYSSSYLPTNTYEISKASEIPTSQTGYYVSTKEQAYQPPVQSTITTTQYSSDLSKPYQTTSYGLKENNFSYIPGPSSTIGTGVGSIGSTGIQSTTTPALTSTTTTSNIASNIPTTGTTSYTSNIYTTPALTGNSSIIKKDDTIEEAIKRSAPPPLKTEIISSSPYTANVASSSNTNFYSPSTTITQPQTTTIVNTTTTTAAKDAYKPSDEIEAILAKYRNSKDSIANIGLSSNFTDIKVSNNTTDAPQINTNTTTTYTTNVQSSATPAYQPYTPSQAYTTSTTTYNVGGVNDYSNNIEGLNNQYSGLNINSNNPNVQVSQVQSSYTAQFNPSSITSAYQPSSTSGISTIGTSAPYTQTYNIQQSFGQSKPYSQYETTTNNFVQEKEYVIENYSNNSKYEGEKLNGTRHGRGKFYYQDGGLFDGEWKENKMHGKGVLSYASGKPAYDGDWVDDKFEGFGVLYNENPAPLNQQYDFNDFDNVEEYWTKYEGQFKDDNKEGFGTLFLSNGEKFVGTFFKDFVNGAGTFYTLSGDVIQGQWHQNKFIS